MEYKIVDNFLPQEEIDMIRNVMTEGQNFEWYLNNFIAEEHDRETHPKDYYFTHLFYAFSNLAASYRIDIFKNFLELIDCKALIRVKGNLYPSGEKLVHHKNHKDFTFSHKAALLYVNDNDGFTVLNDKIFVESKANRVLFFDPQIPHHSTNCTDARYRVTVNFNYF